MRVTKRFIVASIAVGALVLQPVVAITTAPVANAILGPLTEKLTAPLRGGNHQEKEAAASANASSKAKSPNGSAHSGQTQFTSPTKSEQLASQEAPGSVPVSNSQNTVSQTSDTLEEVDSAPLFFAPASIINPDSGLVLFSEKSEMAVLAALGDGLVPHVRDDFSESGSAILQSSEKGWQLFGASWYWWALAGTGAGITARQLWIKRRVG